MKDELERPPRAYDTADVEALREGERGSHSAARVLRAVLIILALLAGLAVLLAKI